MTTANVLFVLVTQDQEVGWVVWDPASRGWRGAPSGHFIWSGIRRSRPFNGLITFHLKCVPKMGNANKMKRDVSHVINCFFPPPFFASWLSFSDCTESKNDLRQQKHSTLSLNRPCTPMKQNETLAYVQTIKFPPRVLSRESTVF